MKTIKAALAVAGAAALVWAVAAGRAEREGNKVDTRFFELRIYHTAPGKMEALQARFRDHTNKLFEKHGMTIIGFWTPAKPAEADKRLIYILAYPSQEAAEKSWKAFREDPDWLAAKAASEKNGTLVERVESTYLNPTDFSPIK